jgi:hypothetical protein
VIAPEQHLSPGCREARSKGPRHNPSAISLERYFLRCHGSSSFAMQKPSLTLAKAIFKDP